VNRPRPLFCPYETVGALKLAQLGVDERFQGRRLGKVIVSDAFGLAHALSLIVGCRFVSVDARPGLDAWDARLGFKHNKLMKERRLRFALEKNRDPRHLATSMRLDLRQA
jgi:GNAT superfamily N-acetyltransferase